MTWLHDQFGRIFQVDLINLSCNMDNTATCFTFKPSRLKLHLQVWLKAGYSHSFVVEYNLGILNKKKKNL